MMLTQLLPCDSFALLFVHNMSLVRRRHQLHEIAPPLCILHIKRHSMIVFGRRHTIRHDDSQRTSGDGLNSRRQCFDAEFHRPIKIAVIRHRKGRQPMMTTQTDNVIGLEHALQQRIAGSELERNKRHHCRLRHD